MFYTVDKNKMKNNSLNCCQNYMTRVSLSQIKTNYKF